MDWDNREIVAKEFPLDRWEHIPIRTADEGRMFIALRAFGSGRVAMGQARWFGENDGVILIEREQEVEAKVEPPSRSVARVLVGLLVLALGILAVAYGVWAKVTAY